MWPTRARATWRNTSAGWDGQPRRELGTPLALVLAAGLQVVGTVEHPPHHVPLRQADRVIAHGVEHAAVGLALGLGAGGAGGAVAQLRRARASTAPSA